MLLLNAHVIFVLFSSIAWQRTKALTNLIVERLELSSMSVSIAWDAQSVGAGSIDFRLYAVSAGGKIKLAVAYINQIWLATWVWLSLAYFRA